MAFVRLRDGTGQLHRLVDGDLLGRDPRSALVISDPRVSGLHARVALRPDGLSLLSLRGALALGEAEVDEAVLEVGQRWTVAHGAEELEVLEVDHGTGAVPLPPTEDIGSGGLRLVVHFDSAELVGGGLDGPLLLTGLGALLVGVLARAGSPLHWHEAARQLWPVASDQTLAHHKEAVRARWYQLTARLRKELHEAGLERPLLVSRGGTIHLALLPGDRVEVREA